MVLDWAVGNERCEAAQNKENYLYGANSICIDLNPDSGSGYHCNCKDGYEGNPYLKGGCQGIQLIYISTIIFQKIIIINNFFSTKSSHVYYIYIYICGNTLHFRFNSFMLLSIIVLLLSYFFINVPGM